MHSEVQCDSEKVKTMIDFEHMPDKINPHFSSDDVSMSKVRAVYSMNLLPFSHISCYLLFVGEQNTPPSFLFYRTLLRIFLMLCLGLLFAFAKGIDCGLYLLADPILSFKLIEAKGGSDRGGRRLLFEDGFLCPGGDFVLKWLGVDGQGLVEFVLLVEEEGLGMMVVGAYALMHDCYIIQIKLPTLDPCFLHSNYRYQNHNFCLYLKKS